MQHSYCSVGYERRACELHVATLKLILGRYSTPQLVEWSWVIGSSSQWTPLLRRLRLNQRTSAFSNFEQRATLLEKALFLPHG